MEPGLRERIRALFKGGRGVVPAPLGEPDREAVAERLAFAIWDAEGRPDGCGARHWRTAQALARRMPELSAPTVEKEVERLQFESDLAEVQLLLDFISGRSDKAFAWAPHAVVAGANGPGDVTARLIAGDQISLDELRRVALIRFPPDKGLAANAEDAVLLVALRDKLNRFVAPASGLTIAFTLRTWDFLYTGVRYLFSSRDEVTRYWARWRLADRAYPRLGASLLWFVSSALLMFWGGLLVTMFTLSVSYDVATGQARVDRINTLDRQQTDVLASISQLEDVAAAPNVLAAGGGAAGGSQAGGVYVVRYCQKVLLDPVRQGSGGAVQEFDSARQAETCDRLQRLGAQLVSEYVELGGWYQDLQRRCLSSLPMRIGRLLSSAVSRCAATRLSTAGVGADGVVAPPPEFFRVVDVLSDFTNILLPVMYGLIGSVVAALRSIVTKISCSTLAPWDAPLMWTRLLLGSMAGACIGLFFSPAGTNLQGSPGLGSLSLAAIAFLAGYAVDGLFALLDQIIERLFRMEPGARRG